MYRSSLSLLCGLSALAGLSTLGCSSSDSNDTGGGAANIEYVTPKGNPIEAPAKEWTYVDFPDTTCRDGSSAGIVVNLNPASDKVMIFLEGGGACYNQFTCGVNPTNFDETKLSGIKGGILDRDDRNPVKDWNMIYVPFCSGDVHGGARKNATIEGVVGTQQFTGFQNMTAFLERIVPTFPNITQGLLTGSSAGGFGAGLTAQLVASRLPPGLDMVLLDDSGPAMSTTYVPECLQQGWRDAWSFDDTFIKQCGDDCPNKNDFSLSWVEHLVKTFPNSRSGMISAAEDQVIRLFYGYGANDCGVDPTKAAPLMEPATFTAGLMEFRQKIGDKTDKFATYYVPGQKHTYLHDDDFYSKTVGGVTIADWAGNIISGKSIVEVGP